MLGNNSAPSPIRLMGQGGGASHTGDTAESTLATVTIPANSMGPNGRIVVETQWNFTGTAGTKTIKVKLGATALLNAANIATTLADRRTTIIQNQNATGSQSTSIGGSIGNQTSSAWNVASSIDTTVDQTLAITVQNGSAADTSVLTGYQVTLTKA